MSDKKAVGRPPKGNDYRITIRLSDDQLGTISKFGRDYHLTDKQECVNYSEIIRTMIDKLHLIMVLSDEIDTAMHNICLVSELLESVADGCEDSKEADVWADMQQGLLESASFFQCLFSYEDNRPDIKTKAFMFERSHSGLIVSENKRAYR